MIDLSDVVIDYVMAIPTSCQAPEFYIGPNGFEVYATVSKGDREINVACNGEMYLTVPNIYSDGLLVDTDNIIRYPSDLHEYGIDDDIRLNQFIKTVSNAGFQVCHENPWWEIFSDNDPDGIICETFYGAIDQATELLFDEEYWA